MIIGVTCYPIGKSIARAGALGFLLLLGACPGKKAPGGVADQAQAPAAPVAPAKSAAEQPEWAKNPDRAVVAFIGDFRGFQEPCL